MDDNNKLLTVALVALAAVAGGLAVVFSVGLAVQAATAPMTGYLREVADGQKKIGTALAQGKKSDTVALEARVAALEFEVKMLKAGSRLAAPPAPPVEDMNKVYDIPVGDSYVLGPKDAPVTITVFEDFQCPYCAQWYPKVLEGRKAFADKVRVIVKQFPLMQHNMARPAAKAALAAGEQGKFFEMGDLLLVNSAELGSDKFKELAAKESGLTVLATGGRPAAPRIELMTSHTGRGSPPVMK